MRIKFSKYHGLGNDFILTRYIESIDMPSLVQACCDRHTGVGADGMIFVKKNPLEMIYFNQDGSRAPMCGNGIRCFAAYCYDEKIDASAILNVQTLAGEKVVERICEHPLEVRVDMGYPIYSNEKIDVAAHENVWNRQICGVNTYSLFMATTHTVVFVKDAFSKDNIDLGKKICHNALFQKQTNVNFVQIVDKSHMQVMTYERGCGITLACGTGACASVVVAHQLGYVEDVCDVQLKIGHLKIEVRDHVFMRGPAQKICEGEYLW